MTKKKDSDSDTDQELTKIMWESPTTCFNLLKKNSNKEKVRTVAHVVNLSESFQFYNENISIVY